MSATAEQDVRGNVQMILSEIAARMIEIEDLVDLASVDAEATPRQREALLSAIQLAAGSTGTLADSAARALGGEVEPLVAWARPWAAEALQALHKGVAGTFDALPEAQKARFHELVGRQGCGASAGTGG